jgi:hypothetical protein
VKMHIEVQAREPDDFTNCTKFRNHQVYFRINTFRLTRIYEEMSGFRLQLLDQCMDVPKGSLGDVCGYCKNEVRLLTRVGMWEPSTGTSHRLPETGIQETTRSSTVV